MDTKDTEAVFQNAFKERLKTKETQVGLWSNLASNIVAEILSFADFDWILFDTEHAPNDIATLIPQLQAMKGCNTCPIVRPAWNDQILFKRLLDIGFNNFIVPFVQNKEEAEYAVSAVRYPPRGVRGVSVGARGSRYGYTKNYWKEIENHIGLVVQIETLDAVDHIESIFSVEGIDGIFIGPSDLAASMGHLSDVSHPDVQRQMGEIARLCTTKNIPLGTLATGARDGQKYMDMGFDFVGLGSDSGLLKKTSRQLVTHFKQ